MVEVARRFEAKHLHLTLALSVESLRFYFESAAAFGGPGAYSNRVTGWNLQPDHLDRAITFFADRNEDTKLELTSYAAPSLVEAVNDRGFGLRFFTHVLARAPVAGPTDLERLDRENDDLVDAVARHNEQCFAPDVDSPLARALTKKHLRMPTNDTFIVRDEGEIVGVGCSESSDGLTLVFGGAVKPDYRGRGIQRKLMAARLAVAAERGSDLVGVMVGPGTSSERNALRAGFAPAYARAFFSRPLRPR